MKKRLLSLVLSLCLISALMPAAFAGAVSSPEDEAKFLKLPNGETYEIPDLELANADDVTADDLTVRTEAISLMSAEEESIPDSGYAGSGSSADPYRVYNAKGLVNLGKEKFGTTSLVASHVYLMNDINMDEVTLDTDYVFYYFAGVIQSDPALIAAGTPAVIKGLPSDKELVYAWFLGTMGYFDIDLNGQASRLNWLPGMISGQYLPTSVQNVNVFSGSKTESGRIPVQITTADSMANYSPFVFTTGGGFTMKDCANYADITTTSYGSVFFGYYPFDEVGTYTFTNCVNYGTVTMRHAAMFFGNNTPFASGGADNAFAFHDDVTQNHIQFSGCKNEGKIRGTDSAKLFATRAAGTDAISDAYEAYLRSSGVMTEDSVELIGKNLDMKLYADAEGNLTMDPSTDSSVDHYQVSVYTYVQAFTKDNNEQYSWYGNARYGTQERLDNGNTTITLKKYGVCDDPDAVDVGQIEDLYVVSKDGVNYYWLDNEEPHTAVGKEFYWFVSRDRTPSGITPPDIVTLAAYSSDDTLLGTVSDIPLPTAE